MKMKKIKVNWEICHIPEHYSIMRCHNCASFDHKEDSCTCNVTCGYCNGKHCSNECEAENLSCPNCNKANQSLNLELNTNHNAWSRKCTILTRKITKVAQQTDYKNKE